ncbi:hypothetical protein [Flavobacterium sandaracinum]|uniref:Uncharacterized protein n=1 Tax=Flavobacterium sandaracinum TaxID=2541733 RepID=A0A4R5CLX6_9FLAO|nr:hypothetical protein [Flavobacterium sandaracinum]TDE01362.1 hypothetical protein E0F91_14640 [Flavobacterium sandaracinum]
MFYVITQNATTEKVGYLKYIPDTPIDHLNINTFSEKVGRILVSSLSKNGLNKYEIMILGRAEGLEKFISNSAQKIIDLIINFQNSNPQCQ